MEIFTEFQLESAHFLPSVPMGHKCRRIHGHTYRVLVYLSGPVAPHTGWIMDFSDIKKAFEPIHEKLDHRFLNSVPGLENPTSENIAKWIWDNLKPNLAQLSKIVIYETCASGCSYQGPRD